MRLIRINRKDSIAAVVLAGMALLSWIPRLRGPIDLRWDGGTYYVLGTSLAQGSGYRILNEPGNIQATQYPPMLPSIVALHQLVLGTSDFVVVGRFLRASYLLLFIAYILGAYGLLRAFLPRTYAFLGTLVCLFQIHTIFMSDVCFAEIPFAFASVLFALCNLPGASTTRQWWGGLFAAISFGLRSIGVVLFATWAVSSLCERNFKQAAARALVGLALVLSWAGYVAHVESGSEYQHPAYAYQRADYMYINVSYPRNIAYRDSFSPELGYASLLEKAGRILENMKVIPVSLGEAVSTREPIWELFRSEFNKRVNQQIIPAWIVRLPLYLLSAFIAAGIALLVVERQYSIPVYILFFCVAVCATPWPGQFNRYLSSLAPFLALAFFLGVRGVAARISKLIPARAKLVHAGVVGWVALVLGVQAATTSLVFTKWHQKVAFSQNGQGVEYRLFFYQDSDRATDAGLDWLKARAKGTDVVAATIPQWAYLRTGLKSVMPPFELDTEKAQRLLDTVPVKFMIVDEAGLKKYTARVVAANPDRWRRVYADPILNEDGTFGSFEIYERTGLTSGLSPSAHSGIAGL